MALDRRILFTLLGEVVFAAAPLVMVFVVLTQSKGKMHLFASPEWAIAAVILCGQALVKFQIGMLNGRRPNVAAVSLTTILVLVFAVTPTMFVLYKVLENIEAAERGPDMSIGLQIVQVMCFFVGAGLYLIMGAIGDTWRHRSAAGSQSTDRT